jgi:hypothetical protein
MSSASFIPALPDKLLMQYNFFELHPFDGGGSFIHHKYIGTLDDFAAAENILAGAIHDFGTLPELAFDRFERWSTIEQSCWLNRMYFLVPLAKYAAIRQDENTAELVCRVIEHFAANYPAPATAEATSAHYERVVWERDNGYNAHGPEYDAPTEYIWFDFQVASRLLHIAYALWFLRHSPALTAQRRNSFMELLRQHARSIYHVEKFCDKPTPNNHQTLRALALLYACEIFKDEEESRTWLPVATELCQFHILNVFMPDGMSNDLSPSYHFFECWMTRDMLTIAKRNNWHFADAVLQRAARAFAICRLLRQPDGLSPVINDGYALDMTPFLLSIPESPASEKALLPASGLAIRRSGNDYLLFDCSPLMRKLCHYHGGKMSPILFVNGRPFITDGGTCSYDEPEFSLYYKRSAAHSSLTIDGHDDSVLQGRYTWLAAPVIKLSAWRKNSISAVAESNAPGWENIIWQRTLTADDAGLLMEDTVTAQRKIKMTFQLMLHSDVKVIQDGEDILLKNQETVLRLRATLPVSVNQALGYRNFRQQPQLKLIFETTACGGNFKINLTREP